MSRTHEQPNLLSHAQLDICVCIIEQLSAYVGKSHIYGIYSDKKKKKYRNVNNLNLLIFVFICGVCVCVLNISD